MGFLLERFHGVIASEEKPSRLPPRNWLA